MCVVGSSCSYYMLYWVLCGMGSSCSSASKISSASTTKLGKKKNDGGRSIVVSPANDKTSTDSVSAAIFNPDTAKQMFRLSLNATMKPGMSYLTKLPEKGHRVKDVIKMAKEYKSMNACDVYKGRASGTVYNGSKELTQLNTKIYEMFAWSNPLHTDIFPDVRKMEAEIIQMCVDMYNGDENACGSMTSGGTESIMLACKAYRDLALSRGITQPEAIIPKSAHAAFIKACQSFNITPRYVNADPIHMKADIRQVTKFINKNTCMMVASAPDFPLGIIDPVEEMSTLAVVHDIPLHVDACLGGFLIPFMKRAGYKVPLFDFRLPGVTSISCDTHKYGFAPKGSSVILYREQKFREHQFFVITDWQGGVYATPTFSGSRSGAIVAACWATMVHFGEEGYVRATKQIISTARYIKDGLREMEGIYVLGDPLVSVVAVGSDQFDIFRLYSALSQRGWSLNALQYPSSFHICCTMLQTRAGVADELLDDVRECIADILEAPDQGASGMAAFYGASQSIPDRSVVGKFALAYMNALYDTQQPNTHADINNNSEEDTLPQKSQSSYKRRERGSESGSRDSGVFTDSDSNNKLLDINSNGLTDVDI